MELFENVKKEYATGDLDDIFVRIIDGGER